MSRASAVLVCVALLCAPALGRATEPPVKTVPVGEEVDVVLFPSNTLAIVADMSGIGTRSAKLQAYALPDWTPLWSAKAELGKRDFVSGVATWYDAAANRLYVGNGPLTAIDVGSGKILWTLDYDKTGIVSDVGFRGGRLLILGTKAGQGFHIAGSAEEAQVKMRLERYKHPRVICAEAASGEVVWSYQFEGRTKTQTEKFAMFHTPEKHIRVVAPQVLPFEAQGSLVLAGKEICCLEEKTGRSLWKVDKEPTGRLLLDDKGFLLGQLDERLCSLDAKDGRILWKSDKKTAGEYYVEEPFLVHKGVAYAGMDDHIVALALADGKPLWKSKCKIDGVVEFLGVQGDKELTVLCPGEYKMEDDAFQKNYSIHRINLQTGEAKWDFSDGSDIRDWEIRDDGRIMAFEEKRYLELDPEAGTAAMNLKAKKAWRSLSQGQKLYLFGKQGVACFDRGASSSLWEAELEPTKHYDRAYGKDSFTTVGSTVLFPTKSGGVVGLAVADGSKQWSVPTPKDPKTFLSEGGDFLVFAKDKDLGVIDLRGLSK
jgi:outer membrane protein assembly factor BamB